MIDTERVLNQTQTAAQTLLSRYQDATRQFIDSVSASTERLSSDLSTEWKNRTEPSTEQLTETVNELIEWARRNGERMATDLEELRNDLGTRLAPVTIVTKADLAELEARVADAEKNAAKALKASRSKAATQRSSGAKKPSAKKPSGKKA